MYILEMIGFRTHYVERFLGAFLSPKFSTLHFTPKLEHFSDQLFSVIKEAIGI
jgi:hypothetical protein